MNDATTISDKLLLHAFDVEASDIHFSPFPDRVDIYLRIHGRRMFYKSILPSQYQVLITFYKFTSGMDIGEIRKPQNGTIIYKVHPQEYSLRLSTLPVNQSESLAIRILPQQQKMTLDQLFLFPNQLTKIKNWISNRSGIILFTGPTGSGKTTTLYALLETILKEKSYQTITLEDPIEKNMADILQVQVNEKAGVTYQTGLKAALRHDPDIIMVGEIRDSYTARFAFDASLTGHLVLSTLHAKDAPGTIHRLLEMGLKQTDLEQSLIAVAALQLIPIDIDNRTIRRAAILELLEKEALFKTIRNMDIAANDQFHTFDYLRKKAFAYGYFSEENYQVFQEKR
ncbi:competence type IV pilus ATPase ComGA [Virgibacillus halodenitrificans]|uniref:competence type IV pilus ATPase ComGA n=1 Tax=Virgibacillus halodenitrificans TaxID=1482 RepID=UPI001FB3D111|nr:competence type IV pilus ATPase ComGA [Virgibacillus halodenitrificans]MCJ0930876.1 Flp pilus assembly complex ATPase component TadA [Virgibacillus halodenitrificans]MEC2158421.1 competence type IV pilus ATPase ComGA [Virgibacillus halodenitrificans]WHX27498.1 competence type IV pilus ATPase ComGA [Virgibacillus halodenitrificans]